MALTNECDLVLDPFMGVGSALMAGLIHNRRAMRVDLEETYVDLAYQRVQQVINGTLRKKPLGRAGGEILLDFSVQIKKTLLYLRE